MAARDLPRGGRDLPAELPGIAVAESATSVQACQGEVTHGGDLPHRFLMLGNAVSPTGTHPLSMQVLLRSIAGVQPSQAFADNTSGEITCPP